MNTLITDIQRFSLSDGDGIRTTVFLKGCNMKCSWCHNPETLSGEKQLMFYQMKCIGCGKCYEVCPTNSHKVVDGVHVIDRSTCISCGKCAEVCYAEALVMCGTEMTIDEIMNQIVQDKPYYESSNGGVTLSGGEVLCHAAFAKELADACKKEGISVAIESNLSIPMEYVRPLFESVDFVMCDIKLFDDRQHKKYTGVSNETVLKNMTKLDEMNIPFIVRTPIIPGVTDTEENIEAIAEFISRFKNLRRYELLNFNPLGEGKYKGLGTKNDFEKERPLERGSLEHFKLLAKQKGIEVKIV